MSQQSRPFRRVRIAVLALAALYAAFFSFYTCLEHERFRTWAYDLGTFDQGIWLAGHGTDYFVTVRGLHLLGDHVRFFSFVLAPIYWIWDDVRALLILQSVAIAAGAWFLCRIAEHVLPGRPWLRLALCASYLIHPAVQNLNVDHAHPDAFATTFILASIHFLLANRLIAFAIAAALAMSCKEDVPLVFVAMGMALMLDRRRRRTGVVLASIAGLYFAVSVLVILPHFNGVGFYRLRGGAFFTGMGHHGDNPLWILGKIFSPDSLLYYWKVGLPNLFLFLLAPLYAIPALPALAANVLSDATYTRSLEFHYQTSILPFFYLATMQALARICGGRSAVAAEATAPAGHPRLSIVLAVALLATTMVANHFWGRVPMRHASVVFDNWRAMKRDVEFRKIELALEHIPRRAVVAADYTLVPHLSHRQRIYMLPNPFQSDNWAIHGENPHDPEQIEYIAVRNVPGRKITDLVEGLVQTNQFTVIATARDFQLLRRVLLSEQAGCGDWDGDKLITENDLRSIAAAIMHKRNCPLRVCDVDNDGVARSRDALLIGKRLKDPTVTLSCPP